MDIKEIEEIATLRKKVEIMTHLIDELQTANFNAGIRITELEAENDKLRKRTITPRHRMRETR